MLTQEEIKLAHENIEKFRELVNSIDQIFELAESSPNSCGFLVKSSAEKFIKILVKNPDEFERLVKTAGALAKIDTIFPKYRKKIAALIKWRPSILRAIIKNSFSSLCWNYPKNIGYFLQFILNDRELFTELHRSENFNVQMKRYEDQCMKQILENSWAFDLFITPDHAPYDRRMTLYERAIEYPRYASVLIQYVLRDSEKFKRLVNDPNHLCRLKIGFPQFQNALIRPILTNPQERKRLVYSFYDLKKLILAFPQYEKDLFEPALNDHEEFKRLCSVVSGRIFERMHLQQIANLFPQHADTLIQMVLKNPDLFSFLFPNHEPIRLSEMREQFPQYAYVFEKLTVAQARAVLVSNAAIQVSSFVLFQARRQKLGLGRLPEDLLITIAAMTGNPKGNTKETAEKFATAAFFASWPTVKLRPTSRQMCKYAPISL